MATRFLKHRLNGRVYSYHKYLAENKDFYEVSEQEAFPEKFMPAKQKGRKSGLSLETPDVPEPPEGSEELNEQLTKDLEKATGG